MVQAFATHTAAESSRNAGVAEAGLPPGPSSAFETPASLLLSNLPQLSEVPWTAITTFAARSYSWVLDAETTG